MVPIASTKLTLRSTKAYRTELPRSGIMLATSCRSPSARVPEGDGTRVVHTGHVPHDRRGERQRAALRGGQPSFPVTLRKPEGHLLRATPR